ncbi:MAG: protein-L-isoaspartate(D-aspartate) O-methyltransferase [Proteobacteria bacterium]|nr:protein-L-isoaspartate(D-aspartate) O-methyltransferase [Pseudomonadota bacterium]
MSATGGAFRGAYLPDPVREGADAPAPDMALAQFILGLRASGVRDKDLLVSFEKATRGTFLPRTNPSLLYASYPLPIECGAEATAPQVVATVLAAANLKPGLRVLEIGTGSGYQAAVMARYGCQVVTIERFHTLHVNAARAMRRLNIVNVRLEHGDGREGFADAAPYDRILINAGVKDVPDALIEQLSPGGTLVVPVQSGREQRLYAFDDTGDTFRQRDLGRSTFQMIMPGRALVL